MSRVIDVAAAAIVNNQNEVLISLRHPDAHQGGLWEFPGGKVEAGEGIEQALRRELEEELALEIDAARPMISLQHGYSDKTVRLHVWRVSKYRFKKANGEQATTGAEGQPVKWQAIETLNAEDFPAADRAIISALQLPEQYLITGAFDSLDDFKRRLSLALASGIQLVQLRLKSHWVQKNPLLASQALTFAVHTSREQAVRLMLNIPDDMPVTDDVSHCGVHLDSRKLYDPAAVSIKNRTAPALLSASCHTAEDIRQAQRIDADFMVLSPVNNTASHPDATPLGWQQFGALVAGAAMPVYALGGVSQKDLDTAWRHGAQGISGIRCGW